MGASRLTIDDFKPGLVYEESGDSVRDSAVWLVVNVTGRDAHSVTVDELTLVGPYVGKLSHVQIPSGMLDGYCVLSEAP